MSLRNEFILLDAARMEEEMETAKKLNPEFDSLYRGRSEENLASVAPYIFRVERGGEFESWYFEKGWGDAWGVMILSQEEMKTLHRHFRKFLLIRTEDGEELYFRYYDPRVLRIFLPVCNRDQIRDFFGPVDYFICEDEDPGFALVYSVDDGMLLQDRITRDAAMNFVPVAKKKKFSLF
ncbi:MAG TPA: DUF4123 domain-containing protein [Bacteroidales bacterium]|nr:DUF4123 domain-containing protein [Bacteroidales bacterium]